MLNAQLRNGLRAMASKLSRIIPSAGLDQFLKQRCCPALKSLLTFVIKNIDNVS